VLIKQLEMEIENNKLFAKQFISSIVKSPMNEHKDVIEDQTIENIEINA
jgi:hypothetical protein